jgi:nucleoporin NDC1
MFVCMQLHPFFIFKRRIPFAAKHVCKLSIIGFFLSAILSMIIHHPFKYNIANNIATWEEFVAEQILFLVATFAIFLCWELTHTLHRVRVPTYTMFNSSFVFFTLQMLLNFGSII